MKNLSVNLGTATPNRRSGIAWVAFALALAIHVADEATHDFLSTYNPSVRAIRARLPFLPLPTFTFRVWLTLLIAGILLLLCFSPFAFRGASWLRIVSRPLGILVGVLNAALHFSSSVYFHRWMPGVYSSPLLLAAAIFLLASSRLRASAKHTDSRPSLILQSNDLP
jgi:uncharacterized membrane protein required for colicin V production